MRSLPIFLLLAAALSYGSPATYNSLTNWSNAGTQTGSITFEDHTSPYGSISMSYPPFTFYDTGGGTLYILDGSAFSYGNFGTGNFLRGPVGPGFALGISVPAGINGFGFNVASNPADAGLAGTITISVNNGDYVYTSLATQLVGTGATFWGIRFATPITSITISSDNTGYRPMIDNVVYGGPPAAPAEAPEAGTAILIGSSLVLLPTLRRRLFRSPLPPQTFAH